MPVRAVPAAPLVLAVALAASLDGSARAGDDGAARPPASSPLFPYEGDPQAAVTAADAAAAALLAPPTDTPSDPAGAAARWMDLAEEDPEALLEVPGSPGHWRPAREAAFARLAGLPEAGRRAVEARWGGRARSALEEARATGREEPLRRLARDLAPTEAGRRALLLLAERSAERGDPEDAARHLRRFLALSPSAAPRERAAAALRLVDACAAGDDVLGVEEAVRLARDAARLPVPYGAGSTTVAARAEAARGEVRARLAARAAEAGARERDAPPERLAFAWAASIADDVADPTFTDAGAARGRGPAAAADADAVYVGAARRVIRFDAATGLRRWSYPSEEALGGDVASWDRSDPRELPVRAVAVAGDRVLAVLGDPPATEDSTFVLGHEVLRRADLGRESRARLVALDAATGEPRWATGSPREADPVLGAGDVGVASPPLVRGDRVYVVLSARRGAVASWLACLDLGTGAPRFVTYLGRGDRPRNDATDRTLVAAKVDAVPQAQRPSTEGDEVVVSTGAGYVVGVAAEVGRVRWVHALPRFDDADPWNERASHDARNAPIAAFGSWFVADASSPEIAAVERGTGRLRWLAREPHDDEDPSVRIPWGQAVASSAGAEGRPALVLAGGGAHVLLVDAETGRSAAPARREGWISYGRALSRPDGVWIWGPGGAALWRVGADGVEHAVVVDPTGASRPLPARADVVDGGRAFYVLAPDRIVALVPASALGATLASPGRDALDVAARACRRAERSRSADDLAAAARLALASPSPALVDLLDEAVRATFAARTATEGAGGDAVRRAIAGTAPLPPPRRAALLAERIQSEPLPPDGLVALAEALLLDLPPALVPVRGDDGAFVRSDLLALARLRALAAGGDAASLRSREERAAREVPAARARGEAAADDAIRRHDGTVAAWTARLARLSEAVDARRFADAARLAADLRLAPPHLAPLAPAAAQALAALEAEALARAGEPDAARTALLDAVRGGPASVRTLDGTPAAAFEAALRAACPFAPAERSWSRLDAGTEQAPAPRGAVETIESTGPGRPTASALALVAHGVRVEVWDAGTGTLRSSTAADAGFVGAPFVDMEPCAPERAALVATVAAGGPADLAGWRPGDAVVAWDGRPIASAAALRRAVAETPIGTAVRATRLRRGVELEGPVTVVERPDASPPSPLPRHAWWRRANEAVVASAYGLRIVDALAGTSRPLWRCAPRESVRAAAGFAGRVYVDAAADRWSPARIVAVDAETGEERWSARVPGPAVGAPRAVGSAVVVDLGSPARTAILDAADGSVRTVRPRLELADPPPRTWIAPMPRRRSADACGHVATVVARGGGLPPRLVAVDSTTGAVSWTREMPPGRGDESEVVTPLLDAGGLVAWTHRSDAIDVVVPSLSGDRGIAAAALVEGEKFGVHIGDLGALDEDSRLVVRGDVVYVLRASRFGKVTVGAVEIRRGDLDPARGVDPVVWHPAQVLLGARTKPELESPTFFGASATLDGIWVLAGYDAAWGGSPEGVVAWFSPDDEVFLSFPAPQSRRRVPGVVPAGRTAIVPSDEGLLVVPVRSR